MHQGRHLPILAAPRESASRTPGVGTASLDNAIAVLVYAFSVGALAWLLVDAVIPTFDGIDGVRQREFFADHNQRDMDRNNAILVLALLAGSAGWDFAVRDGLRGKPRRFTFAIGITFAALGMLFGALAAYVEFRLFNFQHPDQRAHDLGTAMRSCAIVLSTMGGGVGLAAGVILGQRTRTTFNNVIAGVFVGVVTSIGFTMIVALTLPVYGINLRLPVGAVERLLWFSAVAGFLRVTLSSVATRLPSLRLRSAEL